MSGENEDPSRCANCGVSGSDGIELKTCNACKSVKYCGVKCQKEHWSKHKRACKKRAAELKDEILFKQPESSCWGDCPICFLPMPLDEGKHAMSRCCCKVFCHGCEHYSAHNLSNCVFCRQRPPQKDAEVDKSLKHRAELNDSRALCQLGKLRRDKGEYKKAFAYFSKAAGLGDYVANYELSVLYHKGDGVQKDHKLQVYHLEQAALGGHAKARFNLGCNEWNNGRHKRGIKHWIIGSKLGCNMSFDKLKQMYDIGLKVKHEMVSKDEFAAARAGYQAAIDSMKSTLRQEADEDEFYKE